MWSSEFRFCIGHAPGWPEAYFNFGALQAPNFVARGLWVMARAFAGRITGWSTGDEEINTKGGRTTLPHMAASGVLPMGLGYTDKIKETKGEDEYIECEIWNE